MWLIVGLGNPGPQYRRNRHNIGFMAAEAVHAEFSFPGWKKKFQAELSEGKFPGVEDKVVLIKPQTFMNLSGEAVQAAAAFYKVPLANIIAFHDDLDLAPGKVKVKQGGGDGGHNGLASIDTHLGVDYWRVRLGIGHPLRERLRDSAERSKEISVHLPNKTEMVTSYVLANFSKEDEAWLGPLLKKMAEAFPQFLSESPEKFLNALHQKAA